MTPAHGASAAPRHLEQSSDGELGHRAIPPPVAEALRSRFPLGNRPRPGRLSVAEALRSHFPAQPGRAGLAPEAGPAVCAAARPVLPRRIRRISVPAPRPAEPAASPDVLLRLLDGLQRL